MKKGTKDTIQWHPAFQASIQIEFEAEAEKLTFEPEHLLSKKPMQMDELTITFICNHFPRKMVQHLKEFRGLNIIHVEAGIYYITGDAFPIQLLVTRELDPKENLWLQSLRNNMSKPEEIKTLLKEYETKKSSKLYQAAMEVITRANWDAVKEVKETMCEALKELMAEEFQEQEELVTKRVTEQVTEQVTEEFIRTLSKNITDVDKLAELLNLPVEQINKVLDK